MWMRTRASGADSANTPAPVLVPDAEQGGFSARKAVYIPFSNAIPPIALLDVENCMLCGKCEKVCPTQAVDFFQVTESFRLEARVVILTTGYKITPLANKQQFGEAKIPNVVTALQMERLLAPHGPYNRVLRPSDGMEPDSIAYIQCAGSRDQSMGVPYCSRVCCMYAIKQAMLLSGALPLADITVYFMDIRAFGKGYEQFFQNAIAMGIQFVRGKVASISKGKDGKVLLRFEAQDAEGGVQVAEHDLVVLSLGMTAGWEPRETCGVATAPDGFIRSISPKISPVDTNVEGVFAAGAALGPKDIVDTIVEAGTAAMAASRYLRGS
jgi:heterodisulfide reductase subunit A